MIEREIEFRFYSGQFEKYRSLVVLKYLADVVEEHTDYFVIKYSEDKDFVIFHFLLLLWEKNIIYYGCLENW